MCVRYLTRTGLNFLHFSVVHPKGEVTHPSARSGEQNNRQTSVLCFVMQHALSLFYLHTLLYVPWPFQSLFVLLMNPVPYPSRRNILVATIIHVINLKTTVGSLRDFEKSLKPRRILGAHLFWLGQETLAPPYP